MFNCEYTYINIHPPIYPFHGALLSPFGSHDCTPICPRHFCLQKLLWYGLQSKLGLKFIAQENKAQIKRREVSRVVALLYNNDDWRLSESMISPSQIQPPCLFFNLSSSLYIYLYLCVCMYDGTRAYCVKVGDDPFI